MRIMRPFLPILGLAGAFALGACTASNIAANLRDINNAIATGERSLAAVCQGLPTGAMAATTLACVAHANGTTQDVIGRAIATAQALCAGALQSPSIDSALLQVSRAATVAANGASAGCQ
jgi:hypothetical protein